MELSQNTTTFVVLPASIVAGGDEDDFAGFLVSSESSSQTKSTPGRGREREGERKRDSMSWPVTHGELFVVRHSLNCCSLESLSDGDDGLELWPFVCHTLLNFNNKICSLDEKNII